jgi:hypothetical protein
LGHHAAVGAGLNLLDGPPKKSPIVTTTPEPTDLEHAPETGAVRLPPADEPYRGEHQDQIGDREPGALRDPRADAIGEGNVTELTSDLDDESVQTLEKNSARTSAPGSAPFPRGLRRR